MSTIPPSNTALNILPPTQELAQFSLPSWPSGNKPPCPDPHSFYEKAMKLALEADRWAGFAQQYISQGNVRSARTNLQNLKNATGELGREVAQFHDNWDRCGTRELLPVTVTAMRGEVDALSGSIGRLEDQINDMSSSPIVSGGASDESGVISDIIGGIFILLNRSLSPAH